MINLLPEENKNDIKAEYKARLIVVILVLFFATIIITIIFQTLFYISIISMKKVQLNELSIYTSDFFSNERELNNKIADTNKKLNILKTNEGEKSIYSEIFSVITKDSGNVKIIGLSYEKNRAGIRKVQISGNSPNRESIVDFAKSLSTEGFTEVNSPVSNFIKNKDIEFSIEIIL